MRLNDIANRPGSTKAKARVGRGIGSGSGKTAGRGTKGQLARTGVAPNGFEGGQMPIYMRLPKRGFVNPNGKRFVPVNVGRLQDAVDAKRIDAGLTVTEEALKAAGVLRHGRDGVRLLGGGELKTALTIEVTGASKSAILAVEKAGGRVTVTRPPKPPRAAEAVAEPTAEPPAAG